MSELVLGTDVKRLTVKLSPGSPFAVTLRRKDGAAWTSPPVLKLSDNSTWTATVAGSLASFGETYAEVDRVLALPVKNVRLYLGTKLLARGLVVRS